MVLRGLVKMSLAQKQRWRYFKSLDEKEQGIMAQEERAAVSLQKIGGASARDHARSKDKES